MPARTSIEWADYSSNPLKFKLRGKAQPINLCVPASPGCANCYAAAIQKRFYNVDYAKRVMDKAKPVLVEKELQHILNFKPKPPFKNGRDRAAVFIGDMTDLFGPWVPFDLLDAILAHCALRPDVDWLFLTKHPKRMREYFEYVATNTEQDHVWLTAARKSMKISEIVKVCGLLHGPSSSWTVALPNVWLGTSAENQDQADLRIPELLRTPAAVRFVSLEPLLGQIQLSNFLREDRIYEIKKAREGHIRGREIGSLGNHARRDDLEDGRVEREQMESWTNTKKSTPQTCGERSGEISSGLSNDRGCENLLPSSSTGMASLQWPHTRGNANQPQECGQKGQSTREPRTRFSRGQRPPCVRSRNEGPIRPKKSSINSDGLSGCCDSNDVSFGAKDPKGDRRAVRSLPPSNIEDCTWRQKGKAERSNEGLHRQEVKRIHTSNEVALHLIIIGGESGVGARECDVAWILSVVKQCRAADVPCFVKQAGGNPRDITGNRGPGSPLRLKDPKGGDPSEWPADIRVRQMPGSPVRPSKIPQDSRAK